MSVPSTEILLDASSILNLVNGGTLDLVCELPHKFYVGPIVYGECTERQPCPELDEMISKGKIKLLAGGIIPVSVFASLHTKYGLGDGETECLAYGKVLNYKVCTDDRKARESVIAELSKLSLTGSLGLLKEAAEANLITCSDANKSLRTMKASGGFLPSIDATFFCPPS